MSRDVTIDLTIDRLVLEGVAPGDRQRFLTALRGELERQAGRVGSAELGAAGDRTVASAPLEVARGISSDALGRQVAQHIWNSCRQGES